MKITVAVATQSGPTIQTPVNVSSAYCPPKFRASIPLTWPLTSAVPRSTALSGTAPDGKITVPVRVNPQLPATVAVEQVAASADGTKKTNSVTRRSSVHFLLAANRFISYPSSIWLCTRAAYNYLK